MSAQSAFSGIKVLDFTQGVAGPHSTMLLAQHGADVVDVDPIAVGHEGAVGGDVQSVEPADDTFFVHAHITDSDARSAIDHKAAGAFAAVNELHRTQITMNSRLPVQRQMSPESCVIVEIRIRTAKRRHNVRGCLVV